METPAVEGDNVNLKVFRGATPEEIEAATGPNMEVKIIGQPEANVLRKTRLSDLLALWLATRRLHSC